MGECISGDSTTINDHATGSQKPVSGPACPVPVAPAVELGIRAAESAYTIFDPYILPHGETGSVGRNPSDVSWLREDHHQHCMDNKPTPAALCISTWPFDRPFEEITMMSSSHGDVLASHFFSARNASQRWLGSLQRLFIAWPVYGISPGQPPVAAAAKHTAVIWATASAKNSVQGFCLFFKPLMLCATSVSHLPSSLQGHVARQRHANRLRSHQRFRNKGRMCWLSRCRDSV